MNPDTNIEIHKIHEIQSCIMEIDKNDNKNGKKYNLVFINYIQCNPRTCFRIVNIIIDKIYLHRYIYLNKALSICAHILIMVIFEIYFFFDFIIDIENDKFIGKIDSYFRHLDTIQLNEIERDLMYQLLDNSYHYKENIVETLYTNYINSKTRQKQTLDTLFIASCKMGGGIGVVFFILLGVSLHKSCRKYIEWKIIFFENVLMFLFLGIFEYYFFINIIMKYEPVTNEEIQYKITNGGIQYLERLTASQY